MADHSSRILPAMRQMAWERAKGEIRSMLTTYYCEQDGSKFDDMLKAFEDFTKIVEDDGLHE